METSDSEHFESADEDFNTDDEDVTIISNLKSSVKDYRKDSDQNSLKNSNPIETDACGEKKPPQGANKEIVSNKNIEPKNVEVNDAGKPRAASSQAKSSMKLGKKLGQKLDPSKLDEKSENSSLKEIENVESIIETQSLDLSNVNKNELGNEETDLWDETEFDWGEMDKQLERNETASGLDREFNEKCDIRKANVNREENLNSVSSSAGWGDWGNWNVSSFLSTATQGVSTLTSHVSQGFNTVIESSMGIPEPEEMAKINAMGDTKACKKELHDEESEDDQQNQNFPLTFGLGNFVSGVSQFTKLVETTGNKVITGGLGTLETIGKKTMEVLQEGDPGLKKKRAFLQINQDKPILSQVLREAKEKAEADNKRLQEHSKKTTKNYESYFDDHQGLVHLEALELLSKQCSIRLEAVLDNSTGEALVELQETLDQIKELCELPDEEDEDEHLVLPDIKEKLDSAVADLNVPISYEKLLSNWEETDSWLNNLKLNICDELELHQQAIETLAQLTALAVEQFHKAGELLLIKEHRSTADEADSLVQLTSTITSFIGMVAAKFSEKLNVKAATASKENTVNSLITNVFFEAGNSSTYIQDAFQLLIPVLQVGAI